jgi:signal transduction histidine kinase
MRAEVPSPRTLDIALTASILAACVTEALLSDGVTGARWATVLVVTAMSLLLLFRRRHPLATAVILVAVAVPASAALVDPSELISTFFPLLALAYAAGAYAEPRTGRIALAFLLAGVFAVAMFDETKDAGNVYFPCLIVLLCFLGGRTVRTRARHAGELHEAAALAAERREREAQEAVAGERRRIAREMHDVVAHSISLMVIQAGGARRILATDPARAEEAAARIRSAGTEALAEMDVLLGVLESAPDGASPPTLDRLGELVERARAAGLPVTLEITGTRRALSAGAELAVYRVVQEALTNAIKHAGGATTRVQLTWGEDALDVSVADHGDGGPSPQLAGAGHGLMGMRERLRVYGGDVESGPRPDGGFEVAAHLPIERVMAGAP